MRAQTHFNIFSASGQTTGPHFLTKTVSILLAVLFFLSPLGNVAFASQAETEAAYFSQSELADVSNLSSVMEHSGSFNHSYDFSLPAGITGHTPELSLSYSSGAPTDHDIAGYGWTLSVPFIQRINKTGIENLYTDDTFTSSMSGELVSTATSSSEFMAKVEDGSFRIYKQVGDSWEVTEKDGTTYIFGVSPAERQADPSDTSRVYKWMLSSIVDTNGNTITYTYTTDQSQLYIDKITYANGAYEVEFVYEDRVHHPYSFASTFKVTTAKRLKTVTTKHDDTALNSYDFTYTTGDNGVRVILESIQQVDEVTSGTKSPTEFDYSINSGNLTWDVADSIIIPENVGYNGDQGARYVDLNGDGLSDVIRSYDYLEPPYGDHPEEYSIRRVHLATGEGTWDFDVPWDWGDVEIPLAWRSDELLDDITITYDLGSRMVDVNGDGRSDYVTGFKYFNNWSGSNPTYIDYETTRKVYLNTGSGFTHDPSWDIPMEFQGLYFYRKSGNNRNGQFPVRPAMFVDVNGDGLPDIVYASSGSFAAWSGDFNQATTTLSQAVYINTGNGWNLDTTFQLPDNFQVSNVSSRPLDLGARAVDLNNDGLVDFSRGYDRTGNTPYWHDDQTNYINVGKEYSSTTSAHPAKVYSSNYNYAPSNAYRYLDANGDGVTDLVRLWDFENIGSEQIKELHVNNGVYSLSNEWRKDGYQPFYNARYQIEFHEWFRFDNPHDNPSHQLFDYDGDGLIDLVTSNDYSAAWNNPHQMHGYVRTQPGMVKDLLTSITSPEGGVTNIEYQGFREQAGNDPSMFGNAMANPQVVTKITRTTTESAHEETYQYEDGSYYYDSTDVRDRRFAGFGKVTKTTDFGKEVTYYHQGDGDNATTSETGDSEARIGVAYQTEVTDLSDNLYQLTHTKYTDHDLGNGATFVAPATTLTQQYDGDSDHKDSATSYTYDTSNGSLLTQVEHGEVSGNTDGTFTDTGTDSRTTTYAYATSSATGVVTPHTVTLADHNGNTTNETKLSYDNLAHGSVDVGNVTTEEIWVDGSNYASTAYTYDSFGNLLTETDPENNVTTYIYDSFDLYPATVTNDLSQVTTYEYDYRTGQVSKVTDPNGNSTRSVYDGFGRLVAEYIPDPQTGVEVQKTSITYDDTPGDISISRFDFFDGINAISSTQHLDGFGRVIQTRNANENGVAIIDTVYGADGTVASESLPYTGAGFGRTSVTTDPDLLTTYTYDPQKRVTAVTNALGSTNTTYDQWQETVTDSENNDKTFGYDAFGHLTSVDEENGASTYTTNYEYRADDLLTKITDANGNERNLTYDGRGLRTSLEDLHDPADTTFGSWSFTYDDAGNVLTQTDPNGDTTTFTYDDLNRVLTEDSDATTGTDITYTYDTCTEGIGQLCTAVTTDATTDYTYAFTGGVASEDRTIDSTSYTTEYEYDFQGNQTLVTYPDNSEVRYTYNDHNRIETVEQRESGGSWQDIVSDIDYGPHNLLTYQEHGNNVVTNRSYDDSRLYQLQSIISEFVGGTGGPGAEHAAIEAAFFNAEIETENAEELVVEPEIITEAETVPETEVSDETETVIETETDAASTTEFAVVLEASEKALAAEEKAAKNKDKTKTTTPEKTEAQAQKEIAKEDKKEKNKAKDTGKYKDKGHEFELKLKHEAKAQVKKDKGEVTLTNKDATLSVSYNDINANAEYDKKADKIKWKEAKQELHAYELPAKAGMEDGGFEIEVQLNEKPDNNVFTFDLSGYQDLDFFYQPPLTKEAGPGETCTETECVDENGEVTSSRPENVVGSYAVYYKNKLKGDEYRSGKAFHIFRPKIIDADGATIWGELGYKNGTLTVTVPPDFLETAAYPVLVDPTIGYTNVGASDTSAREDFRGSLFTSPSDYSSFDSMTLYCKTTTSNYDMKGMIVDHATLDIVPNGVSNVETCNSTGGWHTLTFASSPTLSANTEYLLGGIGDSSRARLHYDSGTSQQGHTDLSNDYDNPQDLGSASHNSREYSVYITYTAGGGGNAAPTAPTSIETEGATNPVDITDPTPEFTAIYNDPDSGDQATHYEIEVDDNSNFASPIWDTGKTSMSALSEGARSAAVEYAGSALASSTTYYVRHKFWDDDDAEGAWSTETATFSLDAGPPANNPPTVTMLGNSPMSHQEGNIFTDPGATASDPEDGDITSSIVTSGDTIDETTPVGTYFITYTVTDSGGLSDNETRTVNVEAAPGNNPPTITILGNNPLEHIEGTSFTDPGVTASDVEDGDLTASVVTSGDTIDATTPVGTSTITYSVTDSAGATTSTDRIVNVIPPPPIDYLQSLTYTLDNVGNITTIDDQSISTGDTLTTITYDDLYRLDTVTQTGGTAPYSRSYDVDPIGNITNKSDQGAYSYDGHTGSNYANPHAATDIAGNAVTYDDNGNVTDYNGTANTWNYRNELTESVFGDTTITYGYDHTGSRVFKDVSVAGSGGGGGGSGNLEFSDTFDDASDIPLDQHTPNIGGGWTHLINVGNCDLELDVSDGELAAGPSSCGGSDGGLYRTNSMATHADVELSILQIDGDSGDDTNIMACRIQDADNMYAVQWNETGGSQLYKKVSGTWTQLDTNGDRVFDGSTVKLICEGSSITVEDDGTEILSATDSSITAAGYGGLGMGAVIVSGNDVSSQDLNDFSMTTLAGSGGGGGPTEDASTIYVNSLYEVVDGAVTKHIYAGDTLVATIEDGNLTHVHTDHLGSSHIVTDSAGATTQSLTYYPYGDTQLDIQSGTTNQTNRFTGHDYDSETNLSYMGARYQSGKTGRFISQDPLFNQLDRPNLLTNPQKMNAYSYAGNNPIVKFDPTGESEAFIGMMMDMQRVDNLTGGYISNQNRTYAEQAPKAALAAGATVAAAPVLVAAMSAAPYATAGALGNTVFQGYVDIQDGSFDRSTTDYLRDAGFGAAGGQLTVGKNFGQFIITTLGLSLAGQAATDDHTISPTQTVFDVGSAATAKLITPSVTVSSNPVHQSSFNSLAEAFTELSVKIAAFSAFLNRGSEDTEKEDD